MRWLALVIVTLMLVGGEAIAASPRLLTVQEAHAWREDLQYIASELPLRHRDLFRRTSRADFEAAVNKLNARLPALSRHQAIVELARIVALAPDGHTAISSLLYDSPAKFSYLPIALYHFRDGLHVYAADPRYASAVGGKVLRIGNVSTEQAIAAVTPLIPRDNEMVIRERAPLFLIAPEVLHALGLINNAARVPLLLERNGRRFRVELQPNLPPRPANDNWALGQRFSKLDGWTDARRADRPVPLWLRAPTDYFHAEYLPESRTLYAQYNEVANKPDRSVADWVRELEETMRTRDVDRVVLDLRWNTGGNNYLNKPLLLALIKARINRPGGLYAIIGRRNFSAVQNLVNDLDAYTEVLFVGEPTAGNPNFFGDPTSIILPNSRLVVRASTLWWQDVDPRDQRKWTGPDLAVELSFADYRDGRDPALELILGHRPQAPLAELMFEVMSRGDIDEGERIYRAFKADPVNAYAQTEGAMNGLGYRLLGLGHTPQAIRVFSLNVESYSGSANANDSLGEAYLAAGDKARALASYRRVLAIDPVNASATEAVRRIEAER